MLIVWGFFKKLVIADNVGVIANKVFALESPEFFVLWAGVFAFAIQIYADFSAYTDIARGVAKWFGFDLIRNFDHPYLATGPADFWRRWNISLSTWFRDYVYIPLGGSRRGPARTAINLLITFLVSGFWHGASWNYVIWGAYHGVLLIVARAASGLSRVRTARRRMGAAVADRRDVRPDAGRLADLPRDRARSPVARSAAHAVPTSTALGRTDRDVFVPADGAVFAAALDSRLWAEAGGANLAAAVDAPEAAVHWPRVAMQAAVCGLMLAAVLTLRSTAALSFIYFSF